MESEDQTIQNPNQEPILNPIPAPPSHRYPLIAYFSILILLLSASTGFLYYKNQQLKSNLSGYWSQPTPPLMTEPTPTQTPDPTANWKTFISPDSNFSLKYPPEHEIKTVLNLGYVINHTIALPSYPVSISDCKADCDFVGSKQDVIVGNGIKALKVKGYVGAVGGNIPESFIRYEIRNPNSAPERRFNNIILWELPQDIDYQEKTKLYPPSRNVGLIPVDQEKILDRILSTFKFIN